MRTKKYKISPKHRIKVLALGCHPDDIEFMMGGTLLLLRDAGAEIHYCNISDGSLGSTEMSREEIIAKRAAEAESASKVLGAYYYPSMASDLEIFYESSLIKKVASLIRLIVPDILLLPSIEDYMEDHMITARVGVTAAMSRTMPLYETAPWRPANENPIAIYHAMPYGLKDGMNLKVYPEFFINVTGVIDAKENLLRLHESQRTWLDSSQLNGSYLKVMKKMAKEVGTLSKDFLFAEGWRRHNPLGFSDENFDPLSEILSASYGSWP